MIAAPAVVSPLQHDRFMARSRRIASNLPDLRNAASQLPDAVILLDRQQQIRWFNHAAENLLRLRRPQDRGAPLQRRLAGSELAKRSAEHTSELQSLKRISYAVFC